MRYCEAPCEGCPVALIKDQDARQAVQEQIENVFAYYQHQELRSAEGTEWLDDMITTANSTYDPEAQAFVAPEDLNINMVKNGVMKVAREACPQQRHSSVISFRR
jgi:hypothetical protein